MFGRDEYYVSFLGQPSTTEPWMIQFGGHHLGLNITLAGEQRTLAPSHTGAQPAIYELEGKTVRPLGRETDKAFALLSSLNEAQRKQAILDFQMRDLVLGPGRDGQTIQPEGIKGLALTDKQRQMLLDLASEWTGILHEAVAKANMDEMRKNIAETWFAWSGPTEKGCCSRCWRFRPPFSRIGMTSIYRRRLFPSSRVASGCKSILRRAWLSPNG
jgi:hypothetical protein